MSSFIFFIGFHHTNLVGEDLTRYPFISTVLLVMGANGMVEIMGTGGGDCAKNCDTEAWRGVGGYQF